MTTKHFLSLVTVTAIGFFYGRGTVHEPRPIVTIEGPQVVDTTVDPIVTHEPFEWGRTTGRDVPVLVNINGMLSVGFRLFDPEGHEVDYFTDADDEGGNYERAGSDEGSDWSGHEA